MPTPILRTVKEWDSQGYELSVTEKKELYTHREVLRKPPETSSSMTNLTASDVIRLAGRYGWNRLEIITRSVGGGTITGSIYDVTVRES